MITDNGANVIKAVRLLQDHQEGSEQISDSEDSDSSGDEDEDVGNQRSRAFPNFEEEEEQFLKMDTDISQEIETLGKKRGRCFR